jgi:predicted alpha/beta superfamily hydrolase
MERKGPTMSRLGLLVWLATPVAIIIGLYFIAVDRNLGKPDPRLHAISAARLPGQTADSSRFQADVERERAETEARKQAGAGASEEQAPVQVAKHTEKDSPAATPAPAPAPAPAAAAAADDPNFVEPESLETGFILVVEDKTKIANSSTPIYMPSSHNGWNPSDKGMQLQPRSDMRWQIIWDKPKLDSRVAFKFARGSWETVEVTKDFKDVDNRLLPKIDRRTLKPGEKPVIELVIEGWRDQRPDEPGLVATNRYRAIAVGAGTLRRLEVVGGVAPVMRDVLVWLPPGYDDAANAARSYPVLYMQDGQNLFEKLPTLPAEWGADETAAKLIEGGKIEPVIIVGIPSFGNTRISEYSPIPLVQDQPPRAAEYVAFLRREVMPRVERAFRVKTGPEHTAIGGASLGGLVALYAATEHPDVFGSVLAESTPLVRVADGKVTRPGFDHFVKVTTWPKKVYFGMGGKEAGNDPASADASAAYASSASAFEELLKGRGFASDGLKFVVDPAAEHDEVAWAARFGAALEFLFPPAK